MIDADEFNKSGDEVESPMDFVALDLNVCVRAVTNGCTVFPVCSGGPNKGRTCFADADCGSASCGKRCTTD